MSAVAQGLGITPLSPHIGAAVDNRLEDIVASPEPGRAVQAAPDRHLMIRLHQPGALQ